MSSIAKKHGRKSSAKGDSGGDRRGGGRHKNHSISNNRVSKNTQSGGRNNNNNSKRKQNNYYAPHMDPDAVSAALTSGGLLSGKLRVNSKKRDQSFVTVQGVSCDIFIASDKSRNRALDGDMVALRLVNMANWKEVSASSGGAASTEGSSSASGKDGDDQAATKAAEDVNNLWRPRVPESWDFSSSAAAKRGGSGEAKSSVSVSAANRSGPSWKQVREGIAAGLQPQAEVVSILDRKSSPNVICVMDTLCRAEKLTPGKALPSGENFVRLKPVDNRFPYMLLPRHKAPKDFVADPLGSPSRLKLFVVRPHVEEWRESSRFAKCSIVRQLGEAGEISAETEALLMQHGFARRGTDGDFDQDVLDCLESFRISYATAGGGAGPEDAAGAEANSTTTTTAMTSEVDGDDPRTGWSIPDEEVAKRRDLRGHRIFSIDPATAKDLDDALHVTQLLDGRIELGVHIADVSYYVKPGNALDLEASLRATTVYLVQKSLPMLPRLLSENLCSLNPNEDRLAYSCIWYMDAQGNLTNDEPWYGRTVIRSCCKLDYGLAQAMIEENIVSADGHDASKGTRWPVDRRPTGGHAPADVIRDVQLMNAIAKQRRARRYESGSLALQGVKLCFHCDKEGNPIDTFTYPIKDSNRLVEEYMLLANYLVAQKLILGAKNLAAIRRHPGPHPKKLQEYAEQCKTRGFEIDVSSAGKLHSSLLRLHAHPDPIAHYALTTMATVPMKPAVYFAAGTENRDLWRHYALNIPYYTHFTSPIRRYADVMVHRLLTAVLQNKVCDFYKDQSGIHDILEHCNEKKLASKAAQERGDEVYFCVFLQKQAREAEAVVMDWGDSSFELFVPLYGVTKRVHIDDLGCELRKRNTGFSLHPIGEGVAGGAGGAERAAGREASKGRGRGARAPGPHGFSGCRMMPGAIPPGGVHVKMLTRMKVKLFALNKIPIDFAMEVQSVYDHGMEQAYR
jgi:DIS3-like exonuclease 2